MPVTNSLKVALGALVATGLVGAGAVVASSLGGDGSSSSSSTTTSATPTTGSATTTSSAVAPGSMPLGTLTVADPAPGGCPDGFTCSSFQITCPGIDAELRGELAQRLPDSPRGVVMMFSGERGDRWWGLGRGGPTAAFFNQASDAGLGIVQVRWPQGWIVAPEGTEPGAALLACAPATAAAWVHDNVYAPIAPSSSPAGVCGFCLTGNSGGSSQIAYALTRYGLATLVDGAVLTSGPTHTSLDAGCGLDPASTDPALLFEPSAQASIDASYGDGAPCSRRDASFADRLAADSIDGVPAPDLGAVNLRILIGERDRTSAPSHAELFAAWLGGAEVTMVPEMPHTIEQSPSGLDALAGALTG